MKKFLAILSFLIFLTNISFASPILFNPTPLNGSYIYGKDYEIFSVEINDSFNQSSVKLYARVEDPTSVWKSFNMSCYPISSKWLCNSTIPGLEALVHDGNWLLYYFEAYDLEGNYLNLGNSSNPLKVRVDRSSPEITFLSPKNQSYCSGEVEIKINVSDVYSGVNPTSIKYSFDNSSWFDTQLVDEVFVGTQKLNTKNYQNNQSVKIYVRASDMVGNSIDTNIQVLIDNEAPVFSVFGIENNQTMFNIFRVSLNASDRYSGLDLNKIICKLSNHLEYFSCSGTLHEANCSADINTNWVVDGKHEAIFEVFDIAGNKADFSLIVVVDNFPPYIRILSPIQGSILNGLVNISAEVRDEGTGLKDCWFRIESDGAIVREWKEMVCETGFCSAFWNTSEVVDGNYLIRVYAEDFLGRNSSLTSYVSIANVNPLQTTTTLGGSKNEEKVGKKSETQKFFGTNFISNIIKKFKEKPIAALAFLLPLIILPFLLIASKLELGKKMNVEMNFEIFFSELEEINNSLIECLNMKEINEIKDKLRALIIKLEKIEKDPLKKTIEIMLSSEKKLAMQLDSSLKKREGELKHLKAQKDEYFQEVSILLGDCLSSENLEEMKKILGNISTLVRKIRDLTEREIGILNECLDEIRKS